MERQLARARGRPGASAGWTEVVIVSIGTSPIVNSEPNLGHTNASGNCLFGQVPTASPWRIDRCNPLAANHVTPA